MPVRREALPSGLCFPMKYAVIRRNSLSNTFGMVRRNRDGSPRPHQGWDFYAPPNYRCYAIADGEIAAVRNSGSYGRQVILRFTSEAAPNPLYAAFCHLNEVRVIVGQRVKMGEVLGLCGDSGNARGMVGTDAHLHFEIRTHLHVGRGLSHRMSPMQVFESLPLNKIVVTDPALAR